GFDGQLQGELHAGGAGLNAFVQALTESPHSTISIADTSAKEAIENGCERRIPYQPVGPWHRPRLDSAGKAVAHYELVALPPLIHKFRQFGKLIAVVSVPHDDEVAPCAFNASAQCVAVAAFGNVDQTSPVFNRDVDRAIGGAVIGHKHFAANVSGGKGRDGFV